VCVLSVYWRGRCSSKMFAKTNRATWHSIHSPNSGLLWEPRLDHYNADGGDFEWGNGISCAME
jgi:hypothetical protein